MSCMSQGRWTKAGDNPPSASQQGPRGRERAHGIGGQDSKRGKQEGDRTGGVVASRGDTVSGPVDGLGLFNPTLGSEPAENNGRWMSEQGLYHFPWCIRSQSANPKLLEQLSWKTLFSAF